MSGIRGATASVAPRVGASALAGFGRCRGGVTVTPPQEREVSHPLGSQEQLVTLPTVGGIVPGDVAGVDFWIPLRQLRLAPKEDLLCSRYQPNEDPDFEHYTQALAQLGDQIPSLPVLQAHRAIAQGGQEDPIFLVYDHPEVYYALIALQRTRAKVHLPPVATPGAILLHALAQHGQLRREPSVLEVCLAAKRLRDYYGYTLPEIAQMQARNPEENTPPSNTQVHYQILVAELPTSVQELLHKRHILWTHTRYIAEYCGNDEALCVELATLVAQSVRMSVVALNQIIRRLKDGHSRLVTDPDQVVREVPNGAPQLHAAPGTLEAAPSALVVYQRLMAAPAAQVRSAAKSFVVQVAPTETGEQLAVPVQALDGLRGWLNDRVTPTSVRDLEATLLGYLEAVRAAAQREGFLGKDGAIRLVVDSRGSRNSRGKAFGRETKTG